MHTYIFLFTFISSTICLAQGKSTIRVVGSFYDDSTGLDLPTKVYSVVAGKKKLLGQSHREEIFNHKYGFTLDYDVDSLIFQSAGHQTKSFPLHFHGDFTLNTNTYLSIKTLKLGRKERHLRHIIYCKPKNQKNEYRVLHYYDNVLHCKQTFLSGGTQVENENSDDNAFNSHYVIQIFSPSGHYLSQVSYKVKKGINLVDVTAYPLKMEDKKEIEPVPITKQDSLAENGAAIDQPELHNFEKTGIPSIYFEQAKYDLNNDSKAILKEVLEYLKLKQKDQIKLLVKGYTDGVGDKSLNETLAKYRAQTIASYLTNNGVPPKGIEIQWQKKDEIKETQEQLNQYRKVTLTEIR